MWNLEGKFNWDSRLEWGPSEPAIPEPNLGSKSPQMVSAAMKLKVLTPWKKSHEQLRHILKSRDISLPTKIHLVKAMVFPIVMYGCES